MTFLRLSSPDGREELEALEIRPLYWDGKLAGHAFVPSPATGWRDFHLVRRPDGMLEVRTKSGENASTWRLTPAEFLSIARRVERWLDDGGSLGVKIVGVCSPMMRTYAAYYPPGETRPAAKAPGSQLTEREGVVFNDLGDPIARADDQDGIFAIWLRQEAVLFRAGPLDRDKIVRLVESNLAMDMERPPRAHLLLDGPKAQVIAQAAKLLESRVGLFAAREEGGE